MKKKIEFEFIKLHGDQKPIIPKGWVEYTRLEPGGNSFGVVDDETVVLILPEDVANSASRADLEKEKTAAIQGVLMGKMLMAQRGGKP